MNKNISDVLFLSEVNWSYLRQRHHIFTENYAKNGHRVIYVGKIGLRYPRLIDVLKFFNKNEDTQLKSSTQQVYFHKQLLLPPINLIFNYINYVWLANKLLRRVKSNKVIIHFYQPTKLVFDIISKLESTGKQIILIYDCVQDYRFHPSSSKSLLNLENILTQRSALVIADSTINLNRLDSNKKILVPPGVDINHFKIRSFKNLNSSQISKILYYGNIRKDLDIDLINKIGLSKKFDITLLGILNMKKTKFNDKVKILDAVDYNELPLIINKYDALILPYDTENQFTKAIIPAKFFECLSTGLTILSTKMKSTKDYHKYLTIVSKDTDFDKLLINSLNKDLIENLKNLIELSSWNNRFKSFYEKIF